MQKETRKTKDSSTAMPSKSEIASQLKASIVKATTTLRKRLYPTIRRREKLGPEK